MNVKAYRNSVSNLFTENRLLKFALVILLILQVWTQFSLVKASNNQTTIVIPKGLDRAITMQGGEFDTQYFIAMGSYIAQLYWNFTPRHVVGQYQQLATFLAPSAAPQIAPTLFAAADAHKNNEVTMNYIVGDIRVELQPNRVITVKGNLSKHILNNRVSGEERTLRIHYTTAGGRFQILSITEAAK